MKGNVLSEFTANLQKRRIPRLGWYRLPPRCPTAFFDRLAPAGVQLGSTPPRAAAAAKKAPARFGFAAASLLALTINKRKCQSCMGKQGGGIWETRNTYLKSRSPSPPAVRGTEASPFLRFARKVSVFRNVYE